MLHYSHHLNGVIAECFDPRERILLKLLVRTNAVLILRHTYVALIDERRLLWLELLVSPLERLRGIVDDRVPLHRALLLANPRRIRRNPAQLLSVVDDHRLNAASVVERIRAGDEYLPCAVAHGLQLILIGIPFTEITCQEHLIGTGSPLSVVPAVFSLMETEIVCPGCEICDLTVAHESISGALVVVHAKVYVTFKVFEYSVILKNLITHTTPPYSDIFVIYHTLYSTIILK